MSSWGFKRRQINGWALTSKPIEYNHQCPWFVDSIENPEWIGKVVEQFDDGGGYIDIRPYIQENQLIRIFKEKVLPIID